MSCCLIGFGSDYYHAFGGTMPIQLTHAEPNDVDAHTAQALTLVGDDIQDVACTATATILLTKNGKVWHMGTMHGTVTPTPLQVPIALPLKCVELAAGRHFCVARMEGGLAAVSWGAGHFGQLGHGPSICSLSRPKVMEHLLPHNTGSPLKQISVGHWHGMALTQSGTLWAWGSNRRWQCGKRREGDSSKTTPPTLVFPQRIDCPKFASITCGKSHVLALTDEGQVYSWGANHLGQCGHYTRRATIAPPRPIEALQKVCLQQVAAGDSHSLALTGGGRVFCWGSALEGQAGLGTSTLHSPMVRPKLVADLDFAAIHAGQEWKEQQQQQQLLHPDMPPTASPKGSTSTSLEGSSTSKIVTIVAAGSWSMAIDNNGSLYSWGYNDAGVLGLPHPPRRELDVYEPSLFAEKSSGRVLNVQTFDSRHNVLLPRRVQALETYKTLQVSGSAGHAWCICQERRVQDESITVGHTLYEVQEEKRQRGFEHLKNALHNEDTSRTDLEGEQTSEMDEEDEVDDDDEDETHEGEEDATFTETVQTYEIAKKQPSFSRRIIRKLTKKDGGSSSTRGRTARKVVSKVFCKSERQDD